MQTILKELSRKYKISVLNKATFFCFFSLVATERKEVQTSTTCLMKCRAMGLCRDTFWQSGCTNLNAKMRFRPKRGIAFLPDFSDFNRLLSVGYGSLSDCGKIPCIPSFRSEINPKVRNNPFEPMNY
ncbi:hypothetical protein EAVNNN508_03145 [Elizabethkingia anophelis]|nr:hypothetical protein EAVNVB490_00347 [Elizabethkingia anophelis]CAI9669184.1 hypothetical protein EAVNNN508_00347 [Elizabethkingia anophelis]CAI9675741.1 hypothetical protein EAVNVB490_03147 [Elizabethkingia anophelis]CAI9685745.1 hypothetical protein EAVNNN508_03145 [Elizabethkingia anophelis]SPW17630.1 Uncharacterised protein [Elizabethkingia anophelis]